MLALDKLMAVIAPHSCLVCGDEGSLLCDWCAPDALPAIPSRCYRCYKQTEDYATCRPCRAQSPLKHVWVRTGYDALAKQLTRKLKFERAAAAAALLGSLTSEILPYLPPDTLVTHIPTATNRRRQRGYDQAELIARSLAAQLNLKHATLLLRTGQSRQVGASRQKRLTQMATAFLARDSQPINGRTVLLVDDVLTTGASLSAAARVLRGAGAKQVFAAAFAHKK